MISYFLRSILAGVLCMVLPAQAQFSSISPSNNKKHNTAVELIADVQSVQPGTNFTAGILMKMDPGWHTYWKNGGEAGLATTIKWDLPDGFTAGEIQWPVPHKYVEDGDILTYGYAGENLLLVDISVSPDVRMASATLKAEVRWLECEKICIPGSSNVQLTLPVLAEAPRPANAALFEKFRKEIPQPFKSRSVAVTTSAEDEKIKIHLTSTSSSFEASTGALDFYPEIIEGISAGRTVVDVSGTTARLFVPLTADEPLEGDKVLRGVLVYEREGGNREFAALEVSLPQKFTSSLASAAGFAAEGGSVLDRQFNTVETGGAEQPLYVYIFFAIIGGLILNIMPCVLPVIALKIFGLVKMAGNQPREVRKMGLFFSTGIIASFMALAVLVIILKAAGESVGWGFQFQEPLFIIAMGTIVFAFGLSLFGVYEISIPGFALAGANKVGGEAKGGFLAPFSEGVFATILATPCTAPVLGSALGFAFAQPAHVILIIFFSTAFGMALPYLVLTARPAWMKFLPKPGEWMVTAKQFMGFLMMATLIWLLQILGSQLGMEAVIWTAAFLLFVGIACWVIGRFAGLTATRKAYWLSWGSALLLVIAGYQLFITDIMQARNIVGSTAPASTKPSEGGIQWQPFSLQQLESHLGRNEAVFIDFTAEWCLTCKVNEKTVLADRAVISKIEEKGIVPMKADWTNRNEEITQLLAKFGRSGVPLYVLFPAGRPDEPIILPEVITTGIVLEALEKAG